VFALTFFCVGIGLDPVAEDRQVSEWVVALERVSSDTNTFYADDHCRGVVVLLQECTQHIGEAVDGC
jgi:hypothetical protein